MQLDVQGFTTVEGVSNAEPEEFLEVLNSDPAFVEASFLNTGKTQFDLDDVAMLQFHFLLLSNGNSQPTNGMPSTSVPWNPVTRPSNIGSPMGTCSLRHDLITICETCTYSVNHSKTINKKALSRPFVSIAMAINRGLS